MYSQKAGRKKINEILERMKSRENKAKNHIQDLKKSRKFEENQKVEEVLQRNVSNGKMTKLEFRRLQGTLFSIEGCFLEKFEKDIEKRKKNADMREKVKRRMFEDSIKSKLV